MWVFLVRSIGGVNRLTERKNVNNSAINKRKSDIVKAVVLPPLVFFLGECAGAGVGAGTCATAECWMRVRFCHDLRRDESRSRYG